MNVTNRVLTSAAFSASAKLLGKVVGLVSTLILARLLTPEDFGFIALVSIALYFFDILSHAAGEQYIIQKRTVSHFELHTAWSLNLILKTGIAILIVLGAGYIEFFFEKLGLKEAIQVSALILPLQALKSPVYILLKRQLKFSIIFWTSLTERIIGFPCVIVLALWLESYWAFVITDILVAVSAIIISYVVAKKVPVFSLKHVHKQWHFSKWMLAKSTVGYLRAQIDTLFVSKLFGASQLGNYHVSRDIAMMPAHYALSPAIEPVLAAFKDYKESLDELLKQVSFCLSIVILIAMPICWFVFVTSPAIIRVILGENWELAASLLPILIWLFFYWSLVQVAEMALLAIEKVKVLFIFDVLSLLAIFAVLSLASLENPTILLLAWIRVAIGFLSTLLLLLWMYRGRLKLLISPVKILVGFGLLGYLLGALVTLIPMKPTTVLFALGELATKGLAFWGIYGMLILLWLRLSKSAFAVRLAFVITSFWRSRSGH